MTVITSDVIGASGVVGYEFSADNEELVVAGGIRLIATDATGVHTAYANSAISNFGTVASDGFAIASGGAAANLSVYNAGGITGQSGIVGRGVGQKAVNDGTVVATSNGIDFFSTAGGRQEVDNHGTVSGGLFGVRIVSDVTDTAFLGNTGTIVSATNAVVLASTLGGIRSWLDNLGLIAGDSHSVLALDSAVDLHNRGTLRGDVQLDTLADKVANDRGLIEGDVFLDGGADIFNGRGGKVIGTVYGGDGDDVLRGGRGADFLSGGPGADLLVGRKGADHFIFDAVDGAVAVAVGDAAGLAEVDTIRKFARADTIALDDAMFTAIGGPGVLARGRFHVGSEAHDRGDRIVYDRDSGTLYYDADGSRADEAVAFATIGNHARLTHKDFLII